MYILFVVNIFHNASIYIGMHAVISPQISVIFIPITLSSPYSCMIFYRFLQISGSDGTIIHPFTLFSVDEGVIPSVRFSKTVLKRNRKFSHAGDTYRKWRISNACYLGVVVKELEM